MPAAQLSRRQQERLAQMLYYAFIRLRSLPTMLEGQSLDDPQSWKTLATYAMAYGEAFHNVPLAMFGDLDIRFLKSRFVAHARQCPNLLEYIADLEAVEALAGEEPTKA